MISTAVVQRPLGREGWDSPSTNFILPDGTPIDRGATYTVAANSFIATGGDGFTVLKGGQNPETLGSDLDALEAHIDDLPSPFTAPDPTTDPRITKEG